MDEYWDFDHPEDSTYPEMFDGDACPNCNSTNTERIDTVSDDPVIWFCQCGSCGETFEIIVS